MAVSKSSGSLLLSSLCFVAAALVMTCAVWYFYQTGATLYSGDAEAHLNIARRVVESRTPGWAQLGTTWLPLPHLLMTPLVRNDYLWSTGLAGAITSAFCMCIACTFLFSALRRLMHSDVAAVTGTALFLLNPNSLYLGVVPMTEPVFFASLFGLLYFSVRFAETHGFGALLGAAVSACAGTLTRYEAWFLLPFAALFIWWNARPRRWSSLIIFCAIAGAGPVLWLAHNWWFFDDPLYFYRGPWSPRAIQGGRPYPGRGDWQVATQYFVAAGQLVAGWPALAIGAAGSLLAVTRRVWWPVFLLILPPAFYILSMHSSGGTPMHVPQLEPHGWYNIRYAMVLLPLVALGGAAFARFGKVAAAMVLIIAFAPLAAHWNDHSITWQEAEINSRGRRAWTAQAVEFLKMAAGPHETFFTSFNDMTAIYRRRGIPLSDTLTGDNNPQFTMASSRPDLFLWEDWAIVMGGDEVQGVIDRARLHGPRFELSRRFTVKDQPVIEIYHRQYENPLR